MNHTRFMQVRRMYFNGGPAHVLAKPISGSGACTLTPAVQRVRRMYSPYRYKTLIGGISPWGRSAEVGQTHQTNRRQQWNDDEDRDRQGIGLVMNKPGHAAFACGLLSLHPLNCKSFAIVGAVGSSWHSDTSHLLRTCLTNIKTPRRGDRIFGDNLMNQAAETRLARIRAAPRCGARNRTGTPCQCPAIRGRPRCRLHGGRSSGAPTGTGNGNYVDGYFTAEAIEERRWARSLLGTFAKDRSNG
jgi:hypothetical protein